MAACVDGEVLHRRNLPAGYGSASRLAADVADVVAAAGWTPGEVQELYVSRGPGGFTGTRTAVAFAQGVAAASDCQLVPVETPRVIAANVPEAAAVAVVLDARRGSIWVAGFTREENELTSIAGLGLLTPAELDSKLPADAVLVGEGLSYHAEALADWQQAPAEAAWPRVEVVAALGRQQAAARGFVKPASLLPAYVRRPEAEEKRLARIAARGTG